MQSYKITVGRSNDNDLVLADMTVSRSHAEIEMIDGNRLLLTDCQSTQGTFLVQEGTEKKIKQQIITKQDILRFGNITIPVSEILSATHFQEQINFVADASSEETLTDDYNQKFDDNLQSENVKTFSELYLSFSGRISRSTYLLKGILPYFLLSIIFVLVEGLYNADDPDSIGIHSVIFNLVLSIPLLSMAVKRCHDRNKSGWFQFIVLIPIVGALWFLIETWFLKGTDGENKFGRDPLE